MSADRTWTEHFPHPGAEPPHPRPEPETGQTHAQAEALDTWRDAVQILVLWDAAMRRHVVADALDELDRTEIVKRLSPSERIAYELGAAYLEGDL